MITSLHFPQSIVCYIKKAVAEFKTVEKLCSFITAVGKMIRIHNYLVNVNHNPFLYYRIVVGMSSIFGSPRMVRFLQKILILHLWQLESQYS